LIKIFPAPGKPYPLGDHVADSVKIIPAPDLWV